MTSDERAQLQVADALTGAVVVRATFQEPGLLHLACGDRGDVLIVATTRSQYYRGEAVDVVPVLDVSILPPN